MTPVFKILQTDGKARAGQLKTPHGIVETSRFNPVGTQATVKAILPLGHYSYLFIENLMKQIREAIKNNQFKKLKFSWLG